MNHYVDDGSAAAAAATGHKPATTPPPPATVSTISASVITPQHLHHSSIVAGTPPKILSAKALASVASSSAATTPQSGGGTGDAGSDSSSSIRQNHSSRLARPADTEPTTDGDGRLSWLVSPLAGASAGALAKTTIAPLDRTKINFQIHKDIPYSFRAALLYMRTVYRRDGFAALYRGNSATMVRIVPYAAIQFTSHERWRRVLAVDEGGQSTSGRRFLAGSLAGVTSQSLTYPLDMVRARMAVATEPTTLRQVFVRIWRQEGPRTLLRGYGATVLGIIPYAGTSFYTYETLKRRFHEWPGEKRHVSLYMLVFGAAAGAIGQSTSYPLDIVRRRMQTAAVVRGAEDQYETIWSSLRNIYRSEGVRGGFFKGLSMNWIKGPIAVGVSFSTYDLIKSTLQQSELLVGRRRDGNHNSS